jgi:hypothetical protein
MRNSALCAIKNALYNCKLQEKDMVMNEFGWSRLTRYLKSAVHFVSGLNRNRYLTSPNVGTQEQAISMIRNLAFPLLDLEYLRRNLGDLPLLEVVEEGLYSESPDCIIQVRSLTLRKHFPNSSLDARCTCEFSERAI